jgi:outer membrane biosynthesis protein TonB
MKRLMILILAVFMTLCFTASLFAQAATQEQAPAAAAPEEMKAPEAAKEAAEKPAEVKKETKKHKKKHHKKKAAKEEQKPVEPKAEEAPK